MIESAFTIMEHFPGQGDPLDWPCDRFNAAMSYISRKIQAEIERWKRK